MTRCMGLYGSRFPRFGKFIENSTEATLRKVARYRSYVSIGDPEEAQAAESFKKRIQKGDTRYLLGICPGGHNSGVSLVRCSAEKGLDIICNHEEERFTGTKHCTSFPYQSIEALNKSMSELGISLEDIHCFLGTWDYPAFFGFSLGAIAAELPFSWSWLRPSMHKGVADSSPLYKAIWSGAKKLNKTLRTTGKPIIGMPHHDCHAYYSYAVSPFSKTKNTTMILVIDGSGDRSSISMYLGRGSSLELVYQNKSFFDSLGHLYSMMSSSLGGWSPLSSEGRYMGAAAWGLQCRLTNPYYKELRQLLFFAPNGEIFLNRKLAKWHLKGLLAPFSRDLEQIVGQAIPEKMKWNPDAVLDVDTVQHHSITRDRVDKAAALQMLFEDALSHIVGHFIRSTSSEELVLTGGCALNCLANMHLLDHFDDQYYHRYLNKNASFLKLWVPPNPGDAGTPIGAAYAFALQNSCPLGNKLEHAFYCGSGPKSFDIVSNQTTLRSIKWLSCIEICKREDLELFADLVAYLVTNNVILALFQGPAETGPRALGHRSIIANPRNPRIRDLLNESVKFRERIRPLAPMMTLASAKKYFLLHKGAACDQYNSYNYMVLTARAKLVAKQEVPAIIHHDGTSRVQIVRPEHDPLTHLILEKMGVWNEVEMLVNTSFNVGSPIAQTLEQAISTMEKSKGISGLVCRTDDGKLWLAVNTRQNKLTDGGNKVFELIDRWKQIRFKLQSVK